MKDFTTQPMSGKEQETALKLFAKVLAKCTYKHANPLTDNCYISSCGVNEGIYFPNSEIENRLPIHRSYDIDCLSKVDGVLGVVFSLKDDAIFKGLPDFYFEDFDSLIYSKDYRAIRDKINARVKGYAERVATLEKIQRKHKKDGSDFANILANFDGVSLSLEYSIWGHVSAVRVSYRYSLYRKGEKTEKGEPITADEIWELIQQDIATYKGFIDREKTNLKNLEKNLEKFYKIIELRKAFESSVENYNDFNEEAKYMMVR